MSILKYIYLLPLILLSNAAVANSNFYWQFVTTLEKNNTSYLSLNVYQENEIECNTPRNIHGPPPAPDSKDANSSTQYVCIAPGVYSGSALIKVGGMTDAGKNIDCKINIRLVSDRVGYLNFGIPSITCAKTSPGLKITAKGFPNKTLQILVTVPPG